MKKDSQESGKARITAADITQGLKDLGLPAGAVVLVHSSLSRFGYVEGGAEAVVDALLAAVGPEGTVMVPTLPWGGSQYVYLRSRPVFDVRFTPSRMGAISEALRRRPGARRSLHPSHPVAAIGPLAEYMLRDHEKATTCCGLGTPFFRNILVGGYILFLGVDTRCNTTRHTLEEMEIHRFRFSEETFEATVIGWDGIARKVVSRAYSWGQSLPPQQFSFDIPRTEEILEKASVMKVGRIGDATVRLIDARGMCDVVTRMFREDPAPLLRKETPVSPPPEPTEEELRRGVAEALWPGQPARSHGGGILCARYEHEDVVIDDLRLYTPRNPNELIPALLARPRGAEGRLPVIICLHGSGQSREVVMEKDYFSEREKPHLLHGWGRELARRGFATMAITQRCYGGRIGPRIQTWAMTEQLYGRTAMGALVEDAVCAVDYLARQCPDVDPEGIGMTGFSLGGIVTFYSAVVDPRIRAAVPVCGGVGSLEALIDHGSTGYHSAYYYVPGLLKVGDHAEMTAAIAPRALLVIGADQDVGIPLDGVQALERQGRAIYARAGHPEAFSVLVEHGEHNLTPDGLDALTGWFRQHIGRGEGGRP